MGPGAGKLFKKKRLQKWLFLRVPKKSPGPTFGGSFWDLFKSLFFPFFGGPKTSIFHDSGSFLIGIRIYFGKIGRFRDPGRDCQKGPKSTLFWTPFLAGQNRSGGGPKKAKTRGLAIWPQNPSRGRDFPWGCRGSPWGSRGVPWEGFGTPYISKEKRNSRSTASAAPY